MREVALHCGSEPELVGIYTQADSSTEATLRKGASCQALTDRPAIIFVNSGLLPNTGPFRLYVRLARHFARLGFDCFRFDLSGIGDSNRNLSGLSRDKQQIKDLSDVMDQLEISYNKKQFVVFGICTGADNAHRAMVADPRIIGAIGVDGYFYKTPQYYFNYLTKSLAPRLLKFTVWQEKFNILKEALKDQFNRIFSNINTLTIESTTVPYRWDVPPKTQTAHEYKSFINDNKSTLCIFTASWPYNYQNQHADAFPDIEFGNHIQVLYMEDAAHIFPLSESRDALTDAMSSWLLERF